MLLKQLGHSEQPDQDTISKICLQIVSAFQNSTDKISVNELRYILFNKVDAKIENLPPTKDALTQHIRRVNYQTLVWRQCLDSKPELPSPLNSGWVLIDHQLNPVLFTQDPVSVECVQLVKRNCTSAGFKCRTKQWTCTKKNIGCIQSCACAD